MTKVINVIDATLAFKILVGKVINFFTHIFRISIDRVIINSSLSVLRITAHQFIETGLRDCIVVIITITTTKFLFKAFFFKVATVHIPLVLELILQRATEKTNYERFGSKRGMTCTSPNSKN
ncbi:hypothetical protein ACB098_06G066200 [Castanea mollissima]